MANFRRRRSPGEPVVVTMTQSRLSKTIALLLCFMALIWVWKEENKPIPSSLQEEADDSFQTLLLSDQKSRCVDNDDPPEWEALKIKRNCGQCPDPFQPKQRSGDPSWDTHHQRMVEAARNAAGEELEHGHELDVVILGDSITERFNGTRSMGRHAVPENRAVFEKYFDGHLHPRSDEKDGINHKLQGLALGSSGDISVELLWHLQNGMLPSHLRPKIFVLLIGTNDLGRGGCSKRTTLAGILNVAHYLHAHRPDTPIVLHGLLPRSDGDDDGEYYTLNRYWRDILWINRELKRYGNLHRWCHFVEFNGVFLKRMRDDDHPQGDARSAVVIDSELMPDALHPNAKGYDRWGAVLVERIWKVIDDSQ